jgi:hypothetical protein
MWLRALLWSDMTMYAVSSPHAFNVLASCQPLRLCPPAGCCVSIMLVVMMNTSSNTIIISFHSSKRMLHLLFVVESVHVACARHTLSAAVYVVERPMGSVCVAPCRSASSCMICCEQAVKGLLILAHGHLLLLQLTHLLLSLLLLSLLLLLLCVCPQCSAATLPGNTAGSVTVTCVRLDGKSFTVANATDPSTYKLAVGAPCWQKFGKHSMTPLLWDVQTHMQHC